MTNVTTKTTQYAACLVVTALVQTACSPLTDVQREDREYRRAGFELQFRDYRRRCNATGKKVFIIANQSVGRDGIPNIGDRYYCA